MQKELCRKFCCGLISFQDVTKLQSFGSDISVVIPATVENILPLFFFLFLFFLFVFFLHIFIDFMEKEPCTNFYGVFDHFSRTCEVLNDYIVSQREWRQPRK